MSKLAVLATQLRKSLPRAGFMLPARLEVTGGHSPLR